MKSLCVKGSAGDAIGYLPATTLGYKKAWKDLNDRYNQNGLIIQLLIDELLNLPNVLKNNGVELRKLINFVTSNLSALEACEQELDDLSELNLIFEKGRYFIS